MTPAARRSDDHRVRAVPLAGQSRGPCDDSTPSRRGDLKTQAGEGGVLGGIECGLPPMTVASASLSGAPEKSRRRGPRRGERFRRKNTAVGSAVREHQPAGQDAAPRSRLRSAPSPVSLSGSLTVISAVQNENRGGDLAVDTPAVRRSTASRLAAGRSMGQAPQSPGHAVCHRATAHGFMAGNVPLAFPLTGGERSTTSSGRSKAVTASARNNSTA
jgi:hypothetical protein